jgi:hypothetical protein
VFGEQVGRRRHELVDVFPVDLGEQVLAGREVTVQGALADSGLPGDRVELDLTRSLALSGHMSTLPGREGARRTDRLAQLAEEICDRVGRAIGCATDVTRGGDLTRLVDRAVAEYGQLDVLVSHAGISKIGPMADITIRPAVQG